jgi:NTP pyrophosphatase (non-canonical NTP hydrolase)
MSKDIATLQSQIRQFAENRDWDKFHTPKNLAMAVAGEAGELLAEFQWLTPEESLQLKENQKELVAMEIADVAIYLLRLAEKVGIDLAEAVSKKISINESRFPKN